MKILLESETIFLEMLKYVAIPNIMGDIMKKVYSLIATLVLGMALLMPAVAANGNGAQQFYTPFSSQPLYMNALNEVNSNYALLVEKMATSDTPEQYTEALEQIDALIAQYTVGSNQLFKKDRLMEINDLIVAFI